MCGFLASAFVVILIVATPFVAHSQPHGSLAQKSIMDAPGTSVSVQLMDAWSGQPIANADIKVESDNGIRCVKAPCPTNGKEWAGRSDAAGRLMIPKSEIQASTYVGTSLHESANLEEALSGTSGRWVLDLFPKRLNDEADKRGYKLIDARTGKPLANMSVRLEFPLTGALDTKTNSLGYAFFPWERAYGAPEPAAWVIARGYRRTKIDLSAERRGTKLIKQ